MTKQMMNVRLYFVIQPISIVVVPVGIGQNTIASGFVVPPITFVMVSVVADELALSMLHCILPFADIFVAA